METVFVVLEFGERFICVFSSEEKAAQYVQSQSPGLSYVEAVVE